MGKIVRIQNNLKIHKPASLYEAFSAAEARRLVDTVRVALRTRTRQLADIAIRTQRVVVSVAGGSRRGASPPCAGAPVQRHVSIPDARQHCSPGTVCVEPWLADLESRNS